MTLRISSLAALLVCSLSCVALAAPEPDAKDLVKPTFMADTTAIQPGKPFHVGVLLKLAPKWHIYWTNPGDAGIPTTLEFHLPDGFTASPLQYPVPSRIEQTGGIVMYGYSEAVMLLATITPPQKLDSVKVSIAADLNYLVCEDSCIPGSAKLSLSLPVNTGGQENQKELFATWLARVPVAGDRANSIADYKASASITSSAAAKSAGQVSILINWKNDAPAKVEWFPPSRDGIQFGKSAIESKGKTTTINVTFERFGQQADTKPLDSVVGYSGTSGRAGLLVELDMNAAH